MDARIGAYYYSARYQNGDNNSRMAGARTERTVKEEAAERRAAFPDASYNAPLMTGGLHNLDAMAGLTNAGGAKTPAEMTMDEYKSYIRDRLANIPRHPSQMMDSVAYNISEAGFEAMKNDPEYEKRVFDGLEKSFAENNPWTGVAGGCYVVINIGATKEESSAQSWYAGFQNGKGKDLYDKRSQNSFWESRDMSICFPMGLSANLKLDIKFGPRRLEIRQLRTA